MRPIWKFYMLVKLFKDKLHFFYVRSHCKDYSRGDIKINIKSLNKSILFLSLRVKKSDLQKVHVFMIEYFSSLPLNFANVAIFIFFLHCVDFNIARLFQFTFISAIFTFVIFLYWTLLVFQHLQKIKQTLKVDCTIRLS